MSTLSVYRGLTKQGIGEGPNYRKDYGEQFIAADPPFEQDSDALAMLRPWMTVDAESDAPEELGERLEAWSLVEIGRYTAVTRLAWAPDFDRRRAYFSHARIWPTNHSADPSIYIGQSQAYTPHWRSPPAPPPPTLPPHTAAHATVAAEPQAASAFLAGLLQACLQDRTLIIAVDRYDEFTVGSNLHALVAFARAALPTHHKSGCNVRVYTERPNLFLNRSNPVARMLVVHAHHAYTTSKLAQELGRPPLLLSRAGEPISETDQVSENMRAFATSLTTEFINAHQLIGLLPALAQRISTYITRTPRWSWESEGARQLIRSLQVAAYLTLASGHPDRIGGLVRQYLLPLDRDQRQNLLMPWDTLLLPGDRDSIDDEVLKELVILTRPSRTRHSLGHAARQLARTRNLHIDNRQLVEMLRDASAEHRLQRALELYDDGILSAMRLFPLTTNIPTHTLQDIEHGWRALPLEAEAKQLVHRIDDINIQGLILKDQEAVAWMFEHTASRTHASAPAWNQIVYAVTETIHQTKQAQPAYALSSQLVDALRRHLRTVNIARNIDHFLDGIDLLERHQPNQGQEILLSRKHRIEELSDTDAQRTYIQRALSDAYRAPNQSNLFSSDRKWLPPQQWAVNNSDLLATPEALPYTEDDLLAAYFIRQDPTNIDAIREELTRRLISLQRRRTLLALNKHSGWLLWRNTAQVNPSDLRDIAADWLVAGPHSHNADGWQTTLQDIQVQGGLYLEELRALFKNGAPQWPVDPFNSYNQFIELVGLSRSAWDCVRFLEVCPQNFLIELQKYGNKPSRIDFLIELVEAWQSLHPHAPQIATHWLPIISDLFRSGQRHALRRDEYHALFDLPLDDELRARVINHAINNLNDVDATDPRIAYRSQALLWNQIGQLSQKGLLKNHRTQPRLCHSLYNLTKRLDPSTADLLPSIASLIGEHQLFAERDLTIAYSQALERVVVQTCQGGRLMLNIIPKDQLSQIDQAFQGWHPPHNFEQRTTTKNQSNRHLHQQARWLKKYNLARLLRREANIPRIQERKPRLNRVTHTHNKPASWRGNQQTWDVFVAMCSYHTHFRYRVWDNVLNDAKAYLTQGRESHPLNGIYDHIHSCPDIPRELHNALIHNGRETIVEKITKSTPSRKGDYLNLICEEIGWDGRNYGLHLFMAAHTFDETRPLAAIALDFVWTVYKAQQQRKRPHKKLREYEWWCALFNTMHDLTSTPEDFPFASTQLMLYVDAKGQAYFDQNVVPIRQAMQAGFLSHQERGSQP